MMKRKLKQYADGTEVQAGGLDQVVQQVAQALQQGAPMEEIVMQLLQQFQDPNQVGQILVQAGVPQEQVMQIMQQVMQSAGQGAPEGAAPAGPEGMDPSQMMMAYGGPFGGPGDPPTEIDTQNQDSTVPDRFKGKYFHWAPATAFNPEDKYWFTLGDRLKNIGSRFQKEDPREPKISYQFASGGPINFQQLLEEGGAALENALKSKKIAPFSTNSSEEYVKDLQGAFMTIVSRNNMVANLKRNLEDASDVFAPTPAGIPQAANGIEVMTREEYMADRNAKGFDKTTAGEEWDKAHASKSTNPFPNVNPYAGNMFVGNPGFTGGIPYTIPWSPYGQQNPAMQLNPFAQILGAFQPNFPGGAPIKVRGRGMGRGLETEFLKQGMTGTSPTGETWRVTSVEPRGIFRNKVRYNLAWGDPAAAGTTPETTTSGTTGTNGEVSNVDNRGRIGAPPSFGDDVNYRKLARLERRGAKQRAAGDEAYQELFGHAPATNGPTLDNQPVQLLDSPWGFKRQGPTPDYFGQGLNLKDQDYPDMPIWKENASYPNPGFMNEDVTGFGVENEVYNFDPAYQEYIKANPGAYDVKGRPELTFESEDQFGMRWYKNANTGKYESINPSGSTGYDPEKGFYAKGGSITVKQPMYNIDYNMLADGLYGAGNKVVEWANMLNTGIDPENKFNNFAIENVQGTGAPMTEGLYDQFGRFVPNDLGAKVLAGTGDKSAEFASRDNVFFGGQRVMADGGIHINPENEGEFTAKAQRAGLSVQEFAVKVLNAPEGRYSPETRRQANFARNAANWKKADGGSYQVGDEFDLDANEEEAIAAALKSAGYTFKKIK